MAISCPICFEESNEWFRLHPCGHMLCGVCVRNVRPMQCPQCRSPFDERNVQKTYLPDVGPDTSRAQLDQLRREINQLKRDNRNLRVQAERTAGALRKEKVTTTCLHSTVRRLQAEAQSQESDITMSEQASPSYFRRALSWISRVETDGTSSSPSPPSSSLSSPSPSSPETETETDSTVTLSESVCPHCNGPLPALTEPVSATLPDATTEVNVSSQDDNHASEGVFMDPFPPSSESHSLPLYPTPQPSESSPPIQPIILPIPRTETPSPSASLRRVAAPRGYTTARRVTRPNTVQDESSVPPCTDGGPHDWSRRGSNQYSRKRRCKRCGYYTDERKGVDANGLQSWQIYDAGYGSM